MKRDNPEELYPGENPADESLDGTPFRHCPCHGVGCQRCGGTLWITEEQYQQLVAEGYFDDEED